MALRAAGLDDQAIFDATVFVALRLAFSTVNDALGAAPDKELVDKVPGPVRDAVRYGRTPMTDPSGLTPATVRGATQRRSRHGRRSRC